MLAFGGAFRARMVYLDRITSNVTERPSMGKFLESEKQHQAAFKRDAPFFSNPARSNGTYKEEPRPFCLPAAQADENSSSSHRVEAG